VKRKALPQQAHTSGISPASSRCLKSILVYIFDITMNVLEYIAIYKHIDQKYK